MRLSVVFSTLIITAMGMVGQEKPAEPKPSLPNRGDEQAAIIGVKTLSGDSFNRLARMLSVFNVRYSADDKLRTILVYAPPDVVAQIRKVVEELDRPGSEAAIGRNIEMTLTFLRCTTKPQTTPDELPADLESAAKQLRAATQCKSVELWDVIPIRLQEGKTTDQSIRLPGSIPEVPGAMTTGQIRIVPEAVTRKDSGRFVRFERLNINLRVPYLTSRPGMGSQYQNLEVGLATAGDFKEGQKAILGKLSGAEDGTATFVVIALKVLD